MELPNNPATPRQDRVSGMGPIIQRDDVERSRELRTKRAEQLPFWGALSLTLQTLTASAGPSAESGMGVTGWGVGDVGMGGGMGSGVEWRGAIRFYSAETRFC